MRSSFFLARPIQLLTDVLVPRVNPVPEREKAIGARLREAREVAQLKRTTVALKAGISSDQLASYEFGRVVLPWGVGKKLCELLKINLHWLALGEGSILQGYVTPPEISASPRAPFSEVHDRLVGTEHSEIEAALQGFLAGMRRVVAEMEARRRGNRGYTEAELKALEQIKATFDAVRASFSEAERQQSQSQRTDRPKS